MTEKLIGKRIEVDGRAYYDSEAIGEMIRKAQSVPPSAAVSYEIYMLDDDGKPLAKVATIDEDGKPEGFSGSIADWAQWRVGRRVAIVRAERPGEKFVVERVTRERLEVV